MAQPAILALDFDGVLCDGMREYFESAWRAYRRLRPGAPPRPPAGLFARFARLRPLVESGWEMPVLIHALRAGASRASLLRDWRPDAWLADLAATREAVGAALDRVRDEWIGHDETGRLASHASKSTRKQASSAGVTLLSSASHDFGAQVAVRRAD